jgi:hypothetical protein
MLWYDVVMLGQVKLVMVSCLACLLAREAAMRDMGVAPARNNVLASHANAWSLARTQCVEIRYSHELSNFQGNPTTTTIRNGGQQRGTEAPEGEQVLPG